MASSKPLSIMTVTNTAVTPQNSANQSSYGYTSAYFLLNITATPGGTETLTFALQIKAPGSDTYRTLTAFVASAFNTTGLFPFLISGKGDLMANSGVATSPAVPTTSVANFQGYNIPLPPEFRVVVIHSSTGLWTYTVSAWLFDKG